ncbi:hypothetical protein SM12BL1_39500 [Serratia marcescens]|uniref:hypothetical protein n=1 Tax=Serratia marcescens TaxID=615 RepID=UPI00074542F8|nr:hypothetical protein [Serratia marcescens]CUZ93902.1 Uncharacterised protein [Serratia marcescens]CVA65935.1 Uncharacterised protein [Serratia marcescens]CVB76259.1 Uncharacterised protein [Serratia marcescens]CVC60242.1 Uncharacterised protein [Serratia marcescens]CVD56621.1 Uncharacterised protein [Serratia marcescens]
MAYEWIKIEVVTPDKPEIYQLAEILAIDPDAVLGKLIRIWAWADQQTIDGNANSNAASVTKSAIDRIGFMPGFADALIQVGWLRFDGSILIFPNFDRHNGKSSKKRVLTNRRVTEHREKNNKINAGSVTSAFQKALPEEEIELEEDIKDKTTMSDSNRTADENASHGQEPPTPENPDSESGELAGGAGKADPVETAFEEIFWGAGLRKDAKVKAKNAFRTKFTAWKKTTRGSADEFAQMLADDIRLRVQAKTFGFDKLLPTSYLNGERWNDEKPQVAAQSGAAGARPLVQQGANQVFVDYDALRAGGR